MQYFKISLECFVERNPDVFQSKVNGAIPASFWKSFVVSTLVQTIQWWIENGMKESPKVVMEYFFAVIY
jgi:hypothetical protein